MRRSFVAAPHGFLLAIALAVMLPRPRYFDAHRNSPYLSQRAGVIARRMGAAELPQ